MEEKTRLIDATCPDCRGPLKEVRIDHIVEFECLVGHRFSVESVLALHTEAEERALWAAAVALEEATNLVKATASQFPPEIVERLEGIAARKTEQARTIRGITQQLEPFRTK